MSDEMSDRELQGRVWAEVFDETDEVLPEVLTGDGMLAVLEKMRERGYGVTLIVTLKPFAQFRKTGHPILTERYANTLPRAVALAALAAVRKEAE